MEATISHSPRRRSAGFTLVELLTVIIIIGLLAGILLPTVTSAIKTGHAANSIGQCKNLGDGAELYRDDNNGLYPGQDHTGWRGTYSGSQVLAASVFGYIDTTNGDVFHKITDAGLEPKGGHASFKESYLFTDPDRRNGQSGTYMNTCSDLFPSGKEMAFAYYPARKTAGTTIADKFTYADNQQHTARDATAFANFIKDGRFGSNTPYNEDSFLLFSPGVDREFFSSDDIKNWN